MSTSPQRSQPLPETTPDVIVRRARPEDSAAVAWLAALTFPLACPPGTAVTTMASHVAAHLTPSVFLDWSRSPRHTLLLAETVGPLAPTEPLGYALVQIGEPDGAAESAVLREAAGAGPYAELSKIYAHPAAQGTGVARLLMSAAVDAVGPLAEAAGAGPTAPLWLGTNGQNARAQAFYRKHGFEIVGRRTYDVGGVEHDDVVMLRTA